MVSWSTKITYTYTLVYHFVQKALCLTLYKGILLGWQPITKPGFLLHMHFTIVSINGQTKEESRQ